MGKVLGSGCSKSAYEVVNDPTKVVLYSAKAYAPNWKTEIEYLEKLGEMGFPVLGIDTVWFEHPRSLDYGECMMIVDRYEAQSKTMPSKQWLDLVSEKSVKAFQRIEECAQKNYVALIGDFQFLWAKDGDIVIADPNSLKIVSKETFQTTYAHNLGYLWYSSAQARIEYLWRCKTGEIEDDCADLNGSIYPVAGLGKKDLWTRSTAWWAASGLSYWDRMKKKRLEAESEEATAAAKMGVHTIRHKRVPIAAAGV